jgi:hypothetical protein
MPDYTKSKIYKIVCNVTALIYIGSTTQTLSQRLQNHKKTYRRYLNTNLGYLSSFKIIANENYDIILVEEFPCQNKDQLHSRERYWIENTECVNIYIPTRTDKEYYEQNKEKLFEKRKKYKENNKEKYNEIRKKLSKKYYDNNKEHKKEYRENNKERAQQYREENREKMRKYIKEYNLNNKERAKQYYENNKEKIKEQKKEYYKNNKEKRKEYDKQKYLKNKEKLKPLLQNATSPDNQEALPRDY